MRHRGFLVAPLVFLAALPNAWAGAGDRALEADLSAHYPLALQTALPAARAGDFLAQFVVGGLYESGLGGTLNRRIGDLWVQKAIAQATPAAMVHNDPRGQYVLGRVYCDGYVLGEDFAKCAAWNRKAAAQGYALAMVILAGLMRRGWGVPKDDLKASQLYLVAAKKGLPIAQYQLARRFRYGDGAPLEPKLALGWMRHAAEQGYAPAQFETADMEDRG
ncbi:MAG: sel1 repeat family protein, partial [Elusimicrobia bacterium]|nr:sel1 repeat family protein [Elusimicrobiota bacterium]